MKKAAYAILPAASFLKILVAKKEPGATCTFKWKTSFSLPTKKASIKTKIDTAAAMSVQNTASFLKDIQKADAFLASLALIRHGLSFHLPIHFIPPPVTFP